MIKIYIWKRLAAFSALFLCLIFIHSAFALQEIQKNEAKVEQLLSQADLFFQHGEYQKAIESYLQAASLSEKPIDLSRAYFGLSLSCFYLQNEVSSKKWIKKVLEVDPQKKISTLFYPDSFVRLFNGVKEEDKSRKQEESKEINPKKETAEEKPKEPEKGLSESKTTRPATRQVETQSWIYKLFSPEVEGKWEIGIHYSLWSMDMIKGLFESALIDELDEELRKEITNQVRESHPSVEKSNYEHDLSLDSGGSNYGLEIRFYPQGKKGSFSLGFSFEKTRMRFSVLGPVKQEYTDGTYAEVDGEGYLEVRPFSTNLSFRWDMKPFWRITPYFVLGLGIAPLNGEVRYEYYGSYQWVGPREILEDSQTKTLKEAEEEGDINIPNIFFLLQINLGFQGEIFPYLHLKTELGFWDGFILRFGLIYKF